MPDSDPNNNNDSSWQTRCLQLPQRVSQAFLSPQWMTPLIYNTFRSGLILLYLGTLFAVIGYHNPWVSFVKYVGYGMVIVGVGCLIMAALQGIYRYARANGVNKSLKISL